MRVRHWVNAYTRIGSYKIYKTTAKGTKRHERNGVCILALTCSMAWTFAFLSVKENGLVIEICVTMAILQYCHSFRLNDCRVFYLNLRRAFQIEIYNPSITPHVYDDL